MIRVSAEVEKKIWSYMIKEARPLELALYNYAFHGGSKEAVIIALQAYQNEDGGFGQGIESDFTLPASSPMATSIGLRILTELDCQNAQVDDIITRSISYLESTFNPNRNGWYAVSKQVNEFPHAPWWHHKEDINMTIIDHYWGNPSAELIGYLYIYKKYLKKLDINYLLNVAISELNNRSTFHSEHEIFCYIRLYNMLEPNLQQLMEESLRTGVQQLVNTNEEEWDSYVPSPIRFIMNKQQHRFQIEDDDLKKNVSYLAKKLLEKGYMEPNWQWGVYPEAWSQARKAWIGRRTLETINHLHMFGSVQFN